MIISIQLIAYLLFLMNNNINHILEFLERIFSQEHGVCLLPHRGVPMYFEYVQTGRNNNVIAAKRPLKNQKQTHTNPIKAKLFRQKQGFFETTLVSGPKINCTKKLFYAEQTHFAL